MGNEIFALLDSGSCRTFLGPSAVDLVKTLCIQFKGSEGKCNNGYGLNHADKEGTMASAKTEKTSQPENRPLTAVKKTLSPNMAGSRGAARIHKSRRGLLICCGLVEISSTEEWRLRDFFASEIVRDPSKSRVINLTEHRIDVENHAPIKQRCYPVSPKIQEAIYAEVDKMLEAKIIDPSKSEWSSPIVMIKKLNGTYHFCLDFRRLNMMSEKDAYPLPYMNSILDKLRVARYILTIDLSQAYFQIPLESKSRELSVYGTGERLISFYENAVWSYRGTRDVSTFA
ncbi:hypothetical protein ACFW04_003702 [Cataglyphis niger]